MNRYAEEHLQKGKSQSSGGVTLSISATEPELAPGNILHGEVRVKVDASHRNGIVYEAIRLVFLSIEHSCVWDDQGDFDPLLNEYTSSRVYLDRHVTLAGFKSRTEDGETTAQCRQELMFLQHCATPYATVAPTKQRKDAFQHYTSDELLRGGIEMAVTTMLTTGGTAAAFRNDNAAAANASGGADREAVYGGHEPTSSGGAENAGEQQLAEVNFPVLMPGTHTFPFMFRLPPWLPPSFYYEFFGASGELTYTAYATMLFPGNGAGSWCFRKGRKLRETVRGMRAAFTRASRTNPAVLGGPVLRRRDGTVGQAGSMNAPVVPTEQVLDTEEEEPERAGDRTDGREGAGADEVNRQGDGEDIDMPPHRLLRHLPSSAPSDLVAEAPFDVLSVMPRRQLVANYYQIDSLNLRQRPTETPSPQQGGMHGDHFASSGTNSGDSPSNDGKGHGANKNDAAAGLMESHEDTHLALSSLYQTFRYGWMENLCCLQPQNMLEAEVLVVGARTILLADELGASHALGLHPPPTVANTLPSLPLLRAAMPLLLPGAAVAPADVPWPVAGVTLRVRVRNHCPAVTVNCVRVELKAKVEIFKPLVTPHRFPGLSYSSFDYTAPIPPGNEALFDVRLGLPPRFRRHVTDSSSLLPPPGIRTANMTSNTFVEVSFPDMYTYVEEQEETRGVVIMAEMVDLNDEVLELPVRYS